MLRKIYLILIPFLVSGILVNAQSLEDYLRKGIQNSPLLKEYNNQMGIK